MGKKEEIDRKKIWWQPSIQLFARLSGWIAGPVIMAVFLGKWLDRKYGTEPWLFLVTVLIAFLWSSFGIVHDTNKALKNIEKENRKSEKDKIK